MVKHIIVSQIGSRHRYAIPQVLHEAGMLEALFTDSHSGTTNGQWAVPTNLGAAIWLGGMALTAINKRAI